MDTVDGMLVKNRALSGIGVDGMYVPSRVAVVSRSVCAMFHRHAVIEPQPAPKFARMLKTNVAVTRSLAKRKLAVLVHGARGGSVTALVVVGRLCVGDMCQCLAA